MPEETETVTTEEVTLKDFGDLNEVFDKVFPATAEKKETPPEATPRVPVKAEPGPDAAQVTPPAEPVVPKPAPPAQAKEELPDFLTGQKTEKPPEPEPEVPPPGPKESVGMKQLRTAYENLKKQVQSKESQYLSQIEELKKAPPTAPDSEAIIKQLEGQVQELSGAVERTAIEFHPQFRREFVERRQQLVKDAHGILEEAKIDPVQWDKAMSLTGPARTEALEELYTELPRSTVSELGAAAREIRSLDSRKEAFLADRKGLQERLQQDTVRQQRAAYQEHEKNTLEMLNLAEKDLVDRLGLEVYKKSENPEHSKWNEGVEKMKADARKLMLEVTDPSVMARAALMAPAAIQYRNLYLVMRDRWQEAEQKLKAIEKAEPVVQSRGKAAAAADEKLSFADAVAKAVFSPS